MQKSDKIYVAGHRGMVGSAVCRKLAKEGYENVVTRTRKELDLTDGTAVRSFFESEKPDVVVLAAAKVGGIHANSTYKGEFIYENLAIELNIIEYARKSGTQRLVFLGSTCIYPRECPQPIKEDYLLTSPLEPTNDAYAIAKIAGLKMCEAYREQYGLLYHSVMPTNLYGSGDNYHPENSHVLPALIRRFHEAKEANAPEVVMWGSGTPKREFLYSDDAASAIFHMLNMEDPPNLVNIGTGKEVTIRELAEKVAATVGYEGKIIQDTSKPDGMMRKVTDVTRLHQTGWHASIDLDEGLKQTYQSFLKEKEKGTLRG